MGTIKLYFFFGLQICISFFVSAQSVTLKGTTIAQDNTPIPYVNIGFHQADLGTVSNDKGHFTLRIDPKTITSELIFSHIGYRKQSYGPDQIDSLLSLSQVNIMLDQQALALDTVEVKADRMKTLLMGDSVNSANLFVSFKDSLNLGQEIGRAFKAKGKKPFFLQSLGFSLNNKPSVSYKLRVNIRELKDDEVGDFVHDREIVMQILPAQQRVILDLTPYSVWADHDLLVSVEMIENVAPAQIQFSAGLFQNNIVFIRDASLGKWKQVRGMGLAFELVVLR